MGVVATPPGVGEGRPPSAPALGAEEFEAAKFLQHPAPIPPEMGLKDMQATHRVHVPLAERPKSPEHGRDVDNLCLASSFGTWARARSWTGTARS